MPGLEIQALMDRLCQKDHLAACEALKQLLVLSEKSSAVYGHMARLADMLDGENAYIRMRAFALLSANARWDQDNHLDECVERLLQHIHDAKPIAARKCIQALPEIARYKPELRDGILTALKNANAIRYADSMRSLIEKDICAALSAIEGM